MSTASSSSSANAAKGDQQPMNGADVLVKSLVDHGVEVLFAYPGGCSMPMHQALTRYGDSIRTILPRHEQGGAFAAQGYSRSTGKIGVVMATSGPGATNLVTAIADAKLDSIPMLCITGQVPTGAIGTDAFQETPMVEICRGITKHHYLVTDLADLPRVMKEAFHIATSGRPGPVLVDMPKDVQLGNFPIDMDPEMDLPGYSPEAPKVAGETIKQMAAAIKLARRPVIYAGGGIISGEASEELRELIKKTGIPTVTTIMGLGAVSPDDPRSLDWLGMHGAAYANYAVRDCDLLIALGVRFDDRVTGKVEAFAKDAKIIHVDIDSSELNKNKQAHIPVRGDVKDVLVQLNKIVQPPEIEAWQKTCTELKAKYPLKYDNSFDGILQQHAIATLSDITADRETYVSVGVGQHQMWAAQFFKFRQPRTWMSSSGLGTMGFGLPAAMGVQAAHPDALVIDIDGDGSFQMNIQELATCFCEKLPVKVLLLNNQHLGMVVQWEDRFMDRNRAHTYLGPIDHEEAKGKSTADRFEYASDRYPNFVQIAKGYGCGAATVKKKADLEGAMREMIDHKGPFLLDVEVPYQEHVLPMIPGGMTVDDMLLD
ncbi:biosynthetic-type acetolactate synthase large subunit [Rhodopirellula europaea]|uniref:Acetolactate synthase n=1 Tax=Rhodopirellula europaea SH398 TaxID=1263868 RepID=M5S8Z6_9BACT|nr:biosynthetic-type acetolactate synthase large subunit [Rhodopirellula europaea]EMI27960.1 acetolactate synthase, large subunit, biosynthetic type [Rhodopirellula europaea SH398]MCR9208903.1 biosynthetic-type acetolactate synthase large subunit [bacterium]